MKKEPCAEKVSSLPRHSLLFMVSGSLYGPGTSRCSPVCTRTHTHIYTEALAYNWLPFVHSERADAAEELGFSCAVRTVGCCVFTQFMCGKPRPPSACLHFSSLSVLEPTKKLKIACFDMLEKGTKSKKGRSFSAQPGGGLSALWFDSACRLTETDRTQLLVRKQSR